MRCKLYTYFCRASFRVTKRAISKFNLNHVGLCCSIMEMNNARSKIFLSRPFRYAAIFRAFWFSHVYQFTVNGRLNKPIVVREQASVKSPIWACFRFRTARDPEMKKTLLTYVENIGVTFIGLFPVDKWPHSTIVLIGKHIHGWNHGRMYLNGKLNLGTRIHVLRSWKRARETLIGYNSVTRSDGGTTGKS